MSILTQMTEVPINTTEFLRDFQDEEHGALVLFTGNVRRTNLGRQVVSVSYDAFKPLCEKVLHDLCKAAQEKWGPTLKIALIHRTGTLKVGETSVLIAVSSPHRNEAYQASRMMIEDLKNKAPIWKKQVYEDGESEWLRGHALCQNH